MPDKPLPEQYAELAVELHMMTDEQDDSPESDAIRDKLDPIWYAMTEDQREEAYELTRKTLSERGVTL